MTPELEKVEKVLLRYAELWTLLYKERWMPTQDHIRVTLELFKSPIAGFDAYTSDDALTRLDNFFKCKETWLVASRHNYSVFIKHFHRWVDPKKTTSAQTSRGEIAPRNACQDCGTEMPASGICFKCYPLCDKCKTQHAREITCDEQAQFEAIAKRILDPDNKRGGKTKQLNEVLSTGQPGGHHG